MDGDFGMMRLCEGHSVFLNPRKRPNLDMDAAALLLHPDARFRDDFIRFRWNGISVSLYSRGNMLFYRIEDADLALRYGREIYSLLGLRTSD